MYDIDCINVPFISQDWEICNLANLLKLPVSTTILSHFSEVSKEWGNKVLECIHLSRKCSPWHMEDQADFIKVEGWTGNKTDISKRNVIFLLFWQLFLCIIKPQMTGDASRNISLFFTAGISKCTRSLFLTVYKEFP